MRLALGLEYDGRSYHGFQRQLDVPTVQAALEDALSKIADEPISVVAAGRTDTGVHATGQVVGFQCAAPRAPDAWVRGVNSLTPGSLKVRWVREVPEDFHPRYSASARRYLYLWFEDRVASPLLQGWAVRSPALDESAMHRAAQGLLGERDFTSFRGAGCQSKSAFRCVHRMAVTRLGGFVVLDVTANAFLLHMVRNLASALQQVGSGSREVEWPAQLLARRDRRLLGATAPPDGLYLTDVRYPGFDFPPSPLPGLLRAAGEAARF